VLTESLSVTGSKYPRHQSAGALNQNRYQNRANERVEAFVKTVADEVRKTLDQTGIRRLVIGADDVNAALFREASHDTVKEKIIGVFRVDINAVNFDQILELASPIAVDYERKRESEAVDALADAIGSGNRGAAGAVDVLKALEQGQVFRLIMSGNYAEMGWADLTPCRSMALAMYRRTSRRVAICTTSFRCRLEQDNDPPGTAVTGAQIESRRPLRPRRHRGGSPPGADAPHSNARQTPNSTSSARRRALALVISLRTRTS